MSEKVKNNTENEKVEKNEEAKAVVKEKPGFFTRVKTWVKTHKQGLIGFGAGAAVGVGGSIAAAEVGKRIGNRNNQQVYIDPEDHSLDPNM